MSVNFHTAFKYRLRGLLLLVLPVTLSCSGNSFESFSDTTTDSALYYRAVLSINSGDYDDAVEACTSMSDGAIANRSYIFLCSSAYAGRCGLQMLDHIVFITDYYGGALTDKLFMHYLKQLTGTTSQHMSDCDTAESLLRDIGEAADRNNDENALMILLNLYKIGVYINETADSTDDAAVDAAFNTCSAGSITDAQVIDMAGAFWELKESSAVSAIDGLDDIGTAVTSICTLLDSKAGGSAPYDFCDLTAFPTAANMTAGYLKGMRAVIGDSAVIGINSCTNPGSGGNITTCCP